MEAKQRRPPFPPFDRDSAIQKVRLAEDAWNTRDPERVSLAYTVDDTVGANDQVDGGSGNDVIFGGGNDIVGAVGPNNAIIGIGTDLDFGNSSMPETLNGQDGNDIIFGDYGQLAYFSGLPSLAQTTSPTQGGDDTINGGTGDDRMSGRVGGMCWTPFGICHRQ